MSIYKVFSIYDSKIGSYGVPFFQLHAGQAIRSFQSAARDSTTQIAQFPEDFSLFELGQYDDGIPSFKLHPSPIALGSALSFLKDNS